MKRVLRFVILIAVAAGWVDAQDDHQCISISQTERVALADYVHRQFKVDEAASVTLAEDVLIPDSCFHRLSFTVKNGTRDFTLIIHASPDLRFMSRDLYDRRIDPMQTERQTRSELMASLTAGRAPSRGRPDAPVNIVVFSDFECPYCRALAAVLEHDILPTQGDEVRLTFRNLPLSMHPWAKTAAEAATCAALQSDEAFWAMHDRIYGDQENVTPSNVKERLNGYAEHIPDMDRKVFVECVENALSLGLVMRDLELANANHVGATPTMFINGKRIEGTQTADQMRALIEQAKAEHEQARGGILPTKNVGAASSTFTDPSHGGQSHP